MKYLRQLQAIIIKRPVLLIILGALVLITTSTFVAYKSASIQNFNQDNLANGLMFESKAIFHDSYFQGDHTFLLKWPIFALIGRADSSSIAFKIASAGLYAITVAAIAVLVYFVSKKNKSVTSLMLLAVSLILVLVPSQPAPAFPSPVNMVMTTTRNLEFVIFFVIIWLFSRIVRFRKPFKGILVSWELWTSCLLTALLGASDNLFYFVLILSSIIIASFAFWRHQQKVIPITLIPVGISVIGMIIGGYLLRLISELHITTILPSGAQVTINSSLIGMFDNFLASIQWLLVNSGANFFGKGLSATLIPYLINTLLLLLSIVLVVHFIRRTSLNSDGTLDTRTQFTEWLVVSGVVSIILAIVATYDRIVLARYITLFVFTEISILAYYLSKYFTQPAKTGLLLAAIVSLTAFNAIGIIAANHSLQEELVANQKEYSYFDDIKNAVNSHSIDLLAANFWVAGPVKVHTDRPLAIEPFMPYGEPDYAPIRRLTSEQFYKPSSSVKKSAIYVVSSDADPNYYTAQCQLNTLCTYGNTPITTVSISPVSNLIIKYGEPEARIPIQRADGKASSLFIYSYDIRSRN